MFASQGTALSFETELSPASSFSPGQLPRGCLVEISGTDARWEAARLLAHFRDTPCAWIEEDISTLPAARRSSPLRPRSPTYAFSRRPEGLHLGSFSHALLGPLPGRRLFRAL